MSTELTFDHLSEAATLLRWLVAADEPISVGQPLAIVLTATRELVLPATSDAIIASLSVEPGATIEPQSVVAILQRTATVSERQPRITPVAQRIAAEAQLDLAAISGSGAGGTITKRDVLTLLNDAFTSAAPDDGFCVAEQMGNAIHAAEQIITKPSARSEAPPPPSNGDRRRSTLVPLTAMRRAIAAHMLQAKSTVPHATSATDVDLSTVQSERSRLRSSYARRGVDLTYTACIAQATLRVLPRYPVLNARWHSPDECVYLMNVQLGIAVATPTGLVVPVIRDVADLGLQGLARAINDVAARGKAGTLSPDELRGGTFTITNPGAGVIRFGIPVIPQPQTAILGVGSISKRVVVDDTSGIDQLVLHSLTTLTLSYDARLVSPTVADEFLADLRRELESFRAH